MATCACAAITRATSRCPTRAPGASSAPRGLACRRPTSPAGASAMRAPSGSTTPPWTSPSPQSRSPPTARAARGRSGSAPPSTLRGPTSAAPAGRGAWPSASPAAHSTRPARSCASWTRLGRSSAGTGWALARGQPWRAARRAAGKARAATSRPQARLWLAPTTRRPAWTRRPMGAEENSRIGENQAPRGVSQSGALSAGGASPGAWVSSDSVKRSQH
mmetsp:Transcript_6540/g.22389  ORF Transcript_6540/g.22389 Transcript_6540/m.22389 type:complete len:218 (-) Transcript_6540:105-758(-)